MSTNPPEFDLYLPAGDENGKSGMGIRAVRKFTAQLAPGKAAYPLKHNLGTRDVIVQTRIAGNVREGGISILDQNTVLISFGGPLHEAMDVVIIG